MIGQLAELTPGPYICLGGDEAASTSAADYATFMTWAQQDVVKYGKTAIGWNQITGLHARRRPPSPRTGTPAEPRTLATAAANGTRLIMAPAQPRLHGPEVHGQHGHRAELGREHRRGVGLRLGPGTYLAGAPASAIYGIEAPLWAETVDTPQDIDYQAFPRITAYAELGWSPEAVTSASGAYTNFAQRVAAQGPRWDVMGITYEHSTEIPWQAGPMGPSGPVVSQENDTCLDTGTATNPDGDGALLVQLDACSPGAAGQRWTAATNGTLTLGGQCLDVTGGSTAAGTPVELWACDGGANQQWQTDNGQLLNPQSGLCLTVSTGTDAPGSTLSINSCANSRAQWFTLPAGADGAGPTGPVGSGITGMCLDASGGNSVNLTPADLYTCNGTTAQQWSLESDGTIRTLGMCLDVYGGGRTLGTKVELYTCESGDGAQQWRWSSNGTYGESLTNPQSGLCLDDPGATTTEGTQLQIYTCNGTLAQVWRLP